jgi:hypothetical protein
VYADVFFKVYMDTFLHPYMDGFIRAMTMLEEKDAAALKIEFPVDANLYTMGTPLPPPSQCKKAELAEHPMCKGEADHGFTDGPTCAVGQNPSWGIGSNLTDWWVFRFFFTDFTWKGLGSKGLGFRVQGLGFRDSQLSHGRV